MGPLTLNGPYMGGGEEKGSSRRTMGLEMKSGGQTAKAERKDAEAAIANIIKAFEKSEGER